MSNVEMEIPQQLKSLYRHWELHTKAPSTNKSLIPLDEEVYNEMLALENERMSIYEKKSRGDLAPYTSDPILNTYRFCNIYRELDRQTIAFHTLLLPMRNDFELWLLNMLYCRLIANTDTIARTGLLSFDPQHNKAVSEKLRELPSPKYGTAYIFPISVIQKSAYPAREQFFCLYLPTVIHAVAQEIKTLKKESVVAALKRIIPLFGFNLWFHWTEVLIDVAYQYPEYIDLFKEFPIGPGSQPTMKNLNKKETPEKVCLALTATQLKDFSFLTYNGKPIYLSTENWEGVGCEFRKYTNLKNGNGRRRLYKS